MLATSVGGITLASCVYNASGPKTNSIEALIKIGNTSAGAILSKSATLNAQDGNELPRFINKIDLGGNYCNGSMNSEGLPNQGIDYYINDNALLQIKKCNKPYIVSLSGLTLNDNLEMLDRIFSRPLGNINGIELNLACPNIVNKPVIAYDFDQLDEVLNAISKLIHSIEREIPPLGIKLAPYFDPSHFKKAIEIITKYSVVKYIVTTNTIGNAMFIDAEMECAAIAPRNGLGGLGGGYIKHTALANVYMLYKELVSSGRTDIDIVGVGGVHCGLDAFELILCGARAVQLGTCHWTESGDCFERVSSELKIIMQSKGYNSIEDFRGKLKPYMKGAKQITKMSTYSNSKLKDKSNNSNTLLFIILPMFLIFVLIIFPYISFSIDFAGLRNHYLLRVVNNN